MSGEELIGQRRTHAGDDTAECDVCGIVVSSSQLRDVESSSLLAEHDHVNRICATCWERVSRGDIDLESLLIEEDERRDTPSE